MLKLDKRNKRILELMAKNCRLTDVSIARALGVSKDTVSYRLRNLESEGYLSRYMMFVDARTLGFGRYHLLFRFDAAFSNRLEALKRVAKHDFVMWMNTFVGKFDLQVIVDARTGFELNRIKDDIVRTCENKVRDYIVLAHLHDYEFTQLNPEIDLGTAVNESVESSFHPAITGRRFPVGPEFHQVSLSSLDLELLRRLSEDPRLPIAELSRMTGADRQTVRRRLLRLIKEKVILNFGGIPDVAKLGYVTYYLLVRHSQNAPLEELRKPFAKLRNIFYAGRMNGDYDMILYLNARTPQELNASITLLRSHLDRFIISYDLLVQDEVLHWKQFTSGLYETSRSALND